jgi:hypothetical protein
MSCYDCCRSDVLLIAPEGRASSGATGAQDALGGVIEDGALSDTLDTFLFWFEVVINEPGLYRTVVLEEWLDRKSVV